MLYGIIYKTKKCELSLLSENFDASCFGPVDPTIGHQSVSNSVAFCSH